MTGFERDFDRIARAWLDLGPNEAPDRAVAAALQAVETTAQQRRRFPWPTWRSTTMTRITLLAVLAGTIALIVGGLVLSAGNDGPAPSVAPSPAATASAAASPVAVLPDALKGGWVAPSRGTTIENLTEGAGSALGGNAAVTTVVLMDSADFTPGPAFWLDRRGTPLLQSRVTEESPGVVRFEMATSAGPNCVGPDAGTYRWSQTADGQWLTLELIEDACETRGEILAGTWQRSLAHDNAGGPGIGAVLEPYVTLTLPPGTYTGRGLGGRDELVIDSEAATYKVWKDLDGFVDPCDIDKGRLPIEPGMDALLAYFRDDSRFDVVREDEYEIDGHRAVEIEFVIGPQLEAPCWAFDGNENDRRGVLMWIPEKTDGGFWNGVIGDRGFLVITEVGDATLAFEFGVLTDGVWAVDRDVIDTVRFLETLPEPPAS